MSSVFSSLLSFADILSLIISNFVFIFFAYLIQHFENPIDWTHVLSAEMSKSIMDSAIFLAWSFFPIEKEFPCT